MVLKAVWIAYIRNVDHVRIKIIDNSSVDISVEVDLVLEVSNRRALIEVDEAASEKITEIDIIANRIIDEIGKDNVRIPNVTWVLVQVEGIVDDNIRIVRITFKKEKTVEVMEKIRIRMRWIIQVCNNWGVKYLVFEKKK